MWCAIRTRILASGKRPRSTAILSSICSTRLVAGIVQVTAGCEIMNFNRNCAHDVQSISTAPWGQRMPRKPTEQRPLTKRPVDDHRDPTLGRQRQ